MKRLSYVLVLATGFIWFSPLCYAIDASTLGELEGYTIVAATNTVGDFEGAEDGNVVKLDNGMIFEFHEDDSFDESRPDVIVFAKAVTLPSGQSFMDYKLVISDEDEVFDVTRIK
jgi:hypothetical protein